jgi:hypothetical protein
MIRENFRQPHTVLSNAFTSRVGELTIQYYTEHDGSGVSRDDDAFINIPHIHPGRDKYGVQDLELRRVLDMTMQFTFVVGDVTLNVLDEVVNDGLMRKQLCELIIDRVTRLMNTRNGRSWTKTFEAAKTALQKKVGDLLQSLCFGRFATYSNVGGPRSNCEFGKGRWRTILGREKSVIRSVVGSKHSRPSPRNCQRVHGRQSRTLDGGFPTVTKWPILLLARD